MLFNLAQASDINPTKEGYKDKEEAWIRDAGLNISMKLLSLVSISY